MRTIFAFGTTARAPLPLPVVHLYGCSCSQCNPTGLRRLLPRPRQYMLVTREATWIAHSRRI